VVECGRRIAAPARSSSGRAARRKKKERPEQRLLQPFHADVFTNSNAEERCSIARPQ
jgi:hypothetical protein